MRLVLSFAVLLLVGVSCASVSDDLADEGAGTGLGDGGPRQVVRAEGGRDGPPPPARPLNALCGRVGLCGGRAPDDPLACVGIDAGGQRPTVPADGAEPSGIEGGPDGAEAGGERSPESGPPDAPAPEAAPPEASPDAPITVDAPPTADAAEASAPLDASPDGARVRARAIWQIGDAGVAFGCQVTRDDYDQPIHGCGPVGPGDVGRPCSGASDCGPALACVGTPAPREASAPAGADVGQCRQYCCVGPETCPAGTFCSERPLRGARGATPQLVPVCVIAEDCRLDEPHPCTGPACVCKPNEACTIVVPEQGTTGCVEPGTGATDEPCPCRAGYVCLEATRTCRRVCRLGEASCAPGLCQTAPYFPEGLGLCVGLPPAVP